MGINNIDRVTPNEEITASLWNQFHSALTETFVPRNKDGVAADNVGDLGSVSFKWGTVYADKLNLGGMEFDTSGLTGFGFGPLANRPANPGQGNVYISTPPDNKFYVSYTGGSNSWVAVSAPNLTSGVNPPTGGNFGDMYLRTGTPDRVYFCVSAGTWVELTGGDAASGVDVNIAVGFAYWRDGASSAGRVDLLDSGDNRVTSGSYNQITKILINETGLQTPSAVAPATVIETVDMSAVMDRITDGNKGGSILMRSASEPGDLVAFSVTSINKASGVYTIGVNVEDPPTTGTLQGTDRTWELDFIPFEIPASAVGSTAFVNLRDVKTKEFLTSELGYVPKLVEDDDGVLRLRLLKESGLSAQQAAKLDSIEEGAEVNVNADWDSTGGDSEILNKPTVITQNERDKLASVENNAEENVKSDWNATTGDAEILNKPDIPEESTDLSDMPQTRTGNRMLATKGDGTGYELRDIPSGGSPGQGGSSTFTGLTDTPASYTGQKGKIAKVKTDETGLEFADEGGSGEPNVKSDWNATTGDAEILNKPDATTDPGLMTQADRDKLRGIERGAEVNVKSDWNATTGDAEILNKPATYPVFERVATRIIAADQSMDITVRTAAGLVGNSGPYIEIEHVNNEGKYMDSLLAGSLIYLRSEDENSFTEYEVTADAARVDNVKTWTRFSVTPDYTLPANGKKVFFELRVLGRGSSSFTSLTDTPNSLTAGNIFKVNTDGTALEETDGAELVPDATESAAGKIQIATEAEAKATNNQSTTKAITPKTLDDVLDDRIIDATLIGSSSAAINQPQGADANDLKSTGVTIPATYSWLLITLELSKFDTDADKGFGYGILSKTQFDAIPAVAVDTAATDTNNLEISFIGGAVWGVGRTSANLMTLQFPDDLEDRIKIDKVSVYGADVPFALAAGNGQAGTTTFVGLTDTPNAYTGQGNKFLKVNAAGNAVEFSDGPEVADVADLEAFQAALRYNRVLVSYFIPVPTANVAVNTIQPLIGSDYDQEVTVMINVPETRHTFKMRDLLALSKVAPGTTLNNTNSIHWDAPSGETFRIANGNNGHFLFSSDTVRTTPTGYLVNIRANLIDIATWARQRDNSVLPYARIPKGPFTDLTDTPGSLTGQGGKILEVNSGGTAIEFADKPASGTTTLTGLTDTPGAYTGQAGKILEVNAGESGMTFVDKPTGGSGGGGSSTFEGLTDTPADFTGQAGKILEVNPGEDALVFTDKPTGGGGGGLNQAAVDARVKAGVDDWAETGDTSRIPENKLPRKLDELLDASSDAGWKAEGASAATDVWVTTDASAPLTSRPTLTAAAALTYVQSAERGPRYTGIYDVIRIPNNRVSDIPNLRYIVGDSTLAGDFTVIETGSWSRLGTSGNYTYYTVLVADKPAAAKQMVQEFVKFTIDGTKVEIVPEGDEAFTDLTDTPGSLSGQAGKILEVNSGGTALVFADKPEGGGTGGGEPPSLTMVELATQVNIAEPPRNAAASGSSYSPWTTILTYTVPAGGDGVYTLEGDLNMYISLTADGGGDRVWAETRFTRVRGATTTELVKSDQYPRNVPQIPDTRDLFYEIIHQDELEAGDVINLQARHEVQTVRSGRQLQFRVTDPSTNRMSILKHGTAAAGSSTGGGGGGSAPTLIGTYTTTTTTASPANVYTVDTGIPIPEDGNLVYIELTTVNTSNNSINRARGVFDTDTIRDLDAHTPADPDPTPPSSSNIFISTPFASHFASYYFARTAANNFVLRISRATETTITNTLEVWDVDGSGAMGGGSGVDYDAAAVDVDKPFTIPVQETTLAAQADKSVTFAASGTDWIATGTNLGDLKGVGSIRYSNTSTKAEEYQRFLVTVAHADDETNFDPPSVLRLNSRNHALSYFETGTGTATYRTERVAATDRIASARTVANSNVQFESGTWAGRSDDATADRTLSSVALRRVTNSVESVHALPEDPYDGQKIFLLNDLLVPQPARLTAGSYVDGSNNPIGAGYLQADSVGSLDPTNADLSEFVSFTTRPPRASIRDRLVFTRPTGRSYVPAKVFVNSVEYAVTAVPDLTNSYRSASGNGHVLAAGKEYAIQVEDAQGNKMFPDKTISAGATLSWNAREHTWVRDERGRSEEEIKAIAAEGQGVSEHWFGTQAEYNAVTTKSDDVLYFVGA